MLENVGKYGVKFSFRFYKLILKTKNKTKLELKQENMIKYLRVNNFARKLKYSKVF